MNGVTQNGKVSFIFIQFEILRNERIYTYSVE